MQEQELNDYKEAPQPFDLPSVFAGTRLLFKSEPVEANEHRAEVTTNVPTPNLGVQLPTYRLSYMLLDSSNERIRENSRIVQARLDDEESASPLALGFLAWYLMLREVADQNDARFHPASEIPFTLLQETGERTRTPPHFFTS